MLLFCLYNQLIHSHSIGISFLTKIFKKNETYEAYPLINVNKTYSLEYKY